MQALVDAATPGPWGIGRWQHGNGPWAPIISVEIGAPVCRFDRHGRPDKDIADSAFIAAARTFVPAAIARIRQLEALLGNHESSLQTNQVLVKRLQAVQEVVDSRKGEAMRDYKQAQEDSEESKVAAARMMEVQFVGLALEPTAPQQKGGENNG